MILPAYAVKAGCTVGPHSGQRAFHRLGPKFAPAGGPVIRPGAMNRYYLGGLGAGKTHAGTYELMRRVITNAEYLEKQGFRGGARYLIGAPTDALIEGASWVAVNEWLDRFEALNNWSMVDRIWTSGHRRIRLVTGDLLKFFTLKGAKVAGTNAAGALFDECELADDPMAGFKGLMQRLRDNRFPSERRFLLLTSTPWGANVLYQHFTDKISKGDPAYGMAHGSSYLNPGLDADYISTNTEAMSAREVLEMIEGKPQPADGAVFRAEYDKAASIDFAWRWNGPKPDCKYYVAIDWGGHFHAVFIENDPIDPKTGRECRLGGRDVVFDEVIETGVQTEEFLAEVIKRLDELRLRNKVEVWADYNPTEAVTIANGSRYFDRHCHATRIDDTREKQSGIDTVRWRLRDKDNVRRLVFAQDLRKSSSNRGVLTCMQSYVQESAVIDGIKVLLPSVKQDSIYSHAPDALRAYCWPRYSHLRVHASRHKG